MNTHENRLKDFIDFLSISHLSILKIRSHLIISYMVLVILILKSVLPETSFRIFLNQAKGQQVQFGSTDIRQYFHLFPKAKHSRGEVSLLMGKYSETSILGHFLLYFNLKLLIYTPCVYLCGQKRKKKKEQTNNLDFSHFFPTLHQATLACSVFKLRYEEFPPGLDTTGSIGVAN